MASDNGMNEISRVSQKYATHTVEWKRTRFLGVPIDLLTMDETVAEVDRRLELGVFTQHVVVNVAKVVQMQRDADLRESVESCDIINVDGMGVVWGGRFLGLQIPERVSGIDLFFRLLLLASERRYPVFFLGAKPGVVERAVSEIQSRHPKLNIAGWHHGYFWDREDDLVAEVKTSGAQLLFVAVTSPLKEKFIARRGEELGVNFVMGVGGTFDVVAGLVKRAPVWMQKAGLEWLFRVLQEPRRMWKRYAVTNSKYAWMLLREKFRQGVSA